MFSTLLQVLAGIIPPTHGTIKYFNEGPIDDDDLFRQLTFVAPYMELIEEFTLKEALDFHISFKPLKVGISKKDFYEICYLKDNLNKKVGAFSSGMKQRFKLGLAILSDSQVLLLDEPTSNLDEQGRDWYQNQIKAFSDDRIIVVSSNDPFEYSFCNHHIDITKFKASK